MKTCCITGHRNLTSVQSDLLKTELKREILLAVDSGYTHFISGFAEGVDLIFAEIVAELKSEYPITLEAAIPYRGRLKTLDKIFQKLIRCCDIVKIHSEVYAKSCYMKRNKYMVEQSDLVMAVYDGRESGGTFATLKYAQKLEKKVKINSV